MSAFDRLRAADVVAPDKHSITRFAPFVELSAVDRDEIVTIHERLRARNAELLAENRMLQLEITMQQKLLRLAREGDEWVEDQLVPRRDSA